MCALKFVTSSRNEEIWPHISNADNAASLFRNHFRENLAIAIEENLFFQSSNKKKMFSKISIDNIITIFNVKQIKTTSLAIKSYRSNEMIMILCCGH